MRFFSRQFTCLLSAHRQQLRSYSKQQQSQLSTLERRVAELELAAQQADDRARQLSDEKAQLQQELKATQREMSKLEAFRRNILQSVQDEDPIPGAGIGLGGYVSSAPPALPSTTDFTPAAPALSVRT